MTILLALLLIGYYFIELEDGFFMGLLLGLYGVILSFNLNIEPVETLRFALPPWRSWIIRLALGAVVGLGIWCTTGLGSSTIGGLDTALLLTLLGGLCGLATAFVQPREIERKIKPF